MFLGVCWLAFVLQSFFGALLCISFTSWVLMGTDESLSFVDARKKKKRKKKLITKNGTDYQCSFFFLPFCFVIGDIHNRFAFGFCNHQTPKPFALSFFCYSD